MLFSTYKQCTKKNKGDIPKGEECEEGYQEAQEKEMGQSVIYILHP